MADFPTQHDERCPECGKVLLFKGTVEASGGTWTDAREAPAKEPSKVTAVYACTSCDHSSLWTIDAEGKLTRRTGT